MRTPSKQHYLEAPEYREYVEGHVVRLYASIVLLLLVLGGLVWGTVSATQFAQRSVADSVLVLLALGGMALAGTVVLLLAQLAQWVRRRP
jgi:hypothetical protein